MAPNFKNIKFGRRKSQGNSMDDVGATNIPTAPVSSFRVIPREDTTRKSTGNELDLRKAATSQPARQSSYEYDSGSSNRGSNSSASTMPHNQLFDNTNTRFSSTSTLQSPVEAMKKDRSPSPGFLKLGDDFENDLGDIFSGLDKRKSGVLNDQNGRPMKQSLPRSGSEPSLSNPPKAFGSSYRSSETSPQVGYTNRKDMPSSPSSQWERRKSTDKLMASPDLASADSPTDDVPPPPPPKHKSPARGSKSYTYFALDEPSDYLDEPPRLGHTASVRSQDSYTRGGADEDADAVMVRQSVRAARASTLGRSDFAGSPLAQNEMSGIKHLAPPTSRPLNSSESSLKTASSTSSVDDGQQPSTASSSRAITPEKTDSMLSTPRATRAAPVPATGDEAMFDPGVMHAIQQANTRNMLGLPSESPKLAPQRPQAARVMSMADFEKAKKQNGKSTGRFQAKDDSDSDDNYEDEDDDPVMQAQKRRLEQAKDAQHAVWRQKMKKAIGDQSTMPPLPEFSRNNSSAPNLLFNGEPQAQEDDEDDDIPLAILQAHGFPSKGKAADSRMSQQSYTGIQDRPASASRISQRASQLPVFARRLPEDPYLGAADLATPAHRESLNFTKPHSQSIYGGLSGPPPGQSPVPGLPAGGLVGVIAEEERQRGFRRGSPNGGGGAMGFNLPNHGNMNGAMPMLPMPPQLQMGQDALRNQQMLELMQQNSFMMKEMMEMRTQMQAFQMGGGMGMPPSGMPMAGLPGPGQSRPTSLMPGQAADRRSIAPSTMYGRTMSFMGPPPNLSFMNQQPVVGGGARSVRNVSTGSNLSTMGLGMGPQPGYTPSIAPSERSNIGQPTRYKPVNFGDGGSTITAGSTPRHSQMPTVENKKSGFLNAVVHSGKKSVSRVPADDDDEEQWGAKKRRR